MICTLRYLAIGLVVLLLGANKLSGQENKSQPGGTWRESFDWNPGYQDGIPAKIDVVLRYGVFGGPTYQIIADVQLQDPIVYKDKKYYRSEIGEERWSQISFGYVNIRADILHHSHLVATVEFRHVVDREISNNRTDWDKVFPFVSAEDAKYYFREGFEVTNFRVFDVKPVGLNVLEALRREEQMKERYQALIKEGDSLRKVERWNESIQAYQQALAIDSSDSYPLTRIDEIRERQDREKGEQDRQLKMAEELAGEQVSSTADVDTMIRPPGEPESDIAESATGSAAANIADYQQTQIDQQFEAIDRGFEELGQSLSYGIESGIGLGGIAIGDAIGFSVFCVRKKYAFSFSFATNQLGSQAEDAAIGEFFDETTIGQFTYARPLFQTDMAMPFAGVSWATVSEYRKDGRFDTTSTDDRFEFGLPVGLTGRLGDVFIYQVGRDLVLERNQFMIGFQLSH